MSATPACQHPIANLPRTSNNMASFEARRQENIQVNRLLQAPLQIAAAKISSSSLKSGIQSSSRRKRSFDVYRGPNLPRRTRYGGSYADAGDCASDSDPDEDHETVDWDNSQRSKNDELARPAAAPGKHLALNTSAESSSQTKIPRSVQ